MHHKIWLQGDLVSSEKRIQKIVHFPKNNNIILAFNPVLKGLTQLLKKENQYLMGSIQIEILSNQSQTIKSYQFSISKIFKVIIVNNNKFKNHQRTYMQ